MAPSSTERSHPVYIGNELELFELAHNWKRYVASRIRSFVQGDVLEVGAGLGANVPYYHRDDLHRYVSLEPDERLCAEYRLRQRDGRIPARCELVAGTLATLPASALFDAILYIDVIEHIENDRSEFLRAFDRLRPGGALIVLCPAHNALFSPFDASIGHFRRYNRRMFRALHDHAPARLEYLDSVGLAASLANRILLRQGYPTREQILLWDRVMVPLSRLFDAVTLRRVGKSILGIWRT